MLEMAEKDNKVHLDVVFGMGSKFTGRSVENGVPVTLPLYDLEDILAWKPNDPRDAGQSFSISSVPYYGKVVPKGSTKTLVCHDMAGGYLDDRFVQGCLSTDGKWYYLVYWDIIDTFVYFSHHFITIPPVGWINSAHTNGVAVLGTFITEGDVGFKRCDVIFAKEWVWKAVADQMVEIAKYYRFEGWLLNIENNVDATKVENVRSFVNYLTVKMHDAIEGSQVIWYDSITEDGTLDWQNQLNSRNKTYFDACDGIFLNYNWFKDGLENSVEIAEINDRVQDVYVGVDVFGRGCPGGGGMNSASAMEVIKKYNLSAAIFAPGWVKEEIGSTDFEKNQHKFWTLLSKYCNSHPVFINSEKKYIATNFDPGICMKHDGDKSLRFLHLNRQALMPCLSSEAFLPLEISECGQSFISIKKDVYDTAIFKINFCVRGGDVVVILSAHPSSHIDIELSVDGLTHRRSRMDSRSSIMNSIPGDAPNLIFVFQLKPNSKIDAVVCKSTTQSHKLSKLILSASDFSTCRLENSLSSTSQTFGIGITLEDANWTRDPSDKTALFLSCTLKLEKCDTTQPITVYYKFSADDEDKELGVSRCCKFRVNALSVPNPVFNGPGSMVIFKVEQGEQISPVHPIPLRELWTRQGELVVTYDENMPYDPSE